MMKDDLQTAIFTFFISEAFINFDDTAFFIGEHDPAHPQRHIVFQNKC